MKSFFLFVNFKKFKGSGYRTIDGSLNLKLYSTTSYNMTVMHEKNAVGFVQT